MSLRSRGIIAASGGGEPIDYGTLMVAPFSSQLWSSIDGGTTWTGPVDKRAQISGGVLYTVMGGRYEPNNDIGAVLCQLGVMATTVDNSTFTQRATSMGANDVRGFAGNGSRLVIVGQSGKVETSDDGGASWTVRTFPDVVSQEDLMWDGTNFVSASSALSSVPVIYTSPDGITWTKRIVPWAVAGQTIGMVGRKDTDGRLVAVATSGYIATSDDNGVTWTSRGQPNGVSHFRAVAWTGATGFITMGTLQDVLTSADGVTWSVSATSPFPLGESPLNILWIPAASQFVATTTASRVATSPDGINWTLRTLPGISANRQLHCLVYVPPAA